MRIGEEVLPVRPRQARRDTPKNEENGTSTGSCRWSDNVMCALAKGTIGMSGTVRVEMHKLDGGTKNEQKCEEGYEQKAGQRIRRPYSVGQHHN